MDKGYILMLEADVSDRELSREYFNSRNVKHEFLSYSNEVMAALTAKLISGSQLPRVIIVSLHSVPQNGLFVLQEIKDDDNFKHIPVVLLGENTEGPMIKRCYEFGANSFINKPFTGEQIDTKINSFLDYWFGVAEFAAREKLAYSVG
jgi:CheY-like chemotaxis protein